MFLEFCSLITVRLNRFDSFLLHLLHHNDKVIARSLDLSHFLVTESIEIRQVNIQQAR